MGLGNGKLAPSGYYTAPPFQTVFKLMCLALLTFTQSNIALGTLICDLSILLLQKIFSQK